MIQVRNVRKYAATCDECGRVEEMEYDIDDKEANVTSFVDSIKWISIEDSYRVLTTQRKSHLLCSQRCVLTLYMKSPADLILFEKLCREKKIVT